MSADDTPGATSGPGCRGLAGRLVGTFFFAIFLLAGLAFTAMMVVEAGRDLATWGWEEVPCRIEVSQVERTDGDDDPYRVVVRYRYEAGGRERLGDRVGRHDGGHDSWDAAQRIADRYPAGARASCWVDPEMPDAAVLERGAPWFVLALPLPLVFVAVGAVGLAVLWRRRRERDRPRPLSAQALKGRIDGRRIAIALGAVFLLGGALGSWFLLVRPVARLVDARGWAEVECTVIASDVRSHDSDDGTTYSVDILYEYSWQGRSHRSSRHRFLGGSSSGYAAKRELVERYPVGATRTCWVDPEDPRLAVLDRGFHPVYLLGLIPLAAALGGALALGYGLRRPRQEAAGTAFVARAPAPVERTGRPGQKALGMGCVMLFWNGIVAVFVGVAVQGWRSGDPDWFLTLFLVPFVLVGLLLVVGFVHALMAIANPRVVLRLAPPSPRLGDTVSIEWEVRGRAERLDTLEIVLEGRERATFTRGTDSVTEHQAFHRQVVAASSGIGVARGSTSVWLPEDSMHSFSSSHNGIEWRILVKGEIPRWPDVADEHALEVRPRDPARLVDPRRRR